MNEKGPKGVAKGFDRLAPRYDKLASLVFGKTISKAQNIFADQIPAGSKILILGGGTGSALQGLAATRKSFEIDYVDISGGMLSQAKARLASFGTASDQLNVNFIREDFLKFEPGIQYDAVLTHFFLDVFSREELIQVLRKLDFAVKPGGIWWMADFRKPQKGSGKWIAGILIPVMYWFFRWKTGISAKSLTDFESLARTRNYKPLDTAYFFQRTIFSTFFMKENLVEV